MCSKIELRDGDILRVDFEKGHMAFFRDFLRMEVKQMGSKIMIPKGNLNFVNFAWIKACAELLASTFDMKVEIKKWEIAEVLHIVFCKT